MGVVVLPIKSRICDEKRMVRRESRRLCLFVCVCVVVNREILFHPLKISQWQPTVTRAAVPPSAVAEKFFKTRNNKSSVCVHSACINVLIGTFLFREPRVAWPSVAKCCRWEVLSARNNIVTNICVRWATDKILACGYGGLNSVQRESSLFVSTPEGVKMHNPECCTVTSTKCSLQGWRPKTCSWGALLLHHSDKYCGRL